ncbi:hypothetical protein P3X46_016603 [Hevea brasiliensis]|uniref:Uncharacterized protein n=1 Tax=Hevea brasiliensis TaxID=3981 RepID=A0ABQ9LZN9_HEVBR|nr:hypothetical protein P3X46_016603 [Hevea brasiliensis]
MKLIVLLILSLAATLVLNFSSSLFFFSMLNTIILAVIVGSYGPSVEEGDGVWYSFQSSYDDHSNDSCSEDDDDDSKENYFSDGYDEDDDDSGGDGEIGWEDDDGVDDNLRRRIEDFISKVNKGWREEWLRENLHN